MRISKRLVSVLLLVVVLMTTYAIPANAGYKATGEAVSYQGYSYMIYKDSTKWYAMYHNCDVCPPASHEQGTGDLALSYTQTVTSSSQTAYSFSNSVGCSVSVPELAELTASTTDGLTKTYSLSVQACGGIQKTIPSSAKSGYYKMSICQNFYKYRLDKYATSGLACTKGIYYVAVADGRPYVATLYSKDTKSWKKYS